MTAFQSNFLNLPRVINPPNLTKLNEELSISLKPPTQQDAAGVAEEMWKDSQWTPIANGIENSTFRPNEPDASLAVNNAMRNISVAQTEINSAPPSDELAAIFAGGPTNSGNTIVDKATEAYGATKRYATNVWDKITAKSPTITQLKADGLASVGSTFKATGELTPAQFAALKDQTNNNSALNPDATASSINQAIGPKTQDDHLDYMFSLREVIYEGNIVTFDVMPEVVENRSVDYEAVAPSQFPGAFQKYKGTQSVTWAINAMFISRTSAEATANLARFDMLRSWTMPFFGERTAETYKDQLGAPPPVLWFKGLRGVIGEVPVVVTSLNWNWPRDVDYIPASRDGNNNIPWPTVIQIAINVTESFSTEEFNNFDLAAYRRGDIFGAYHLINVVPQETVVEKTMEAQQLTSIGVIEGGGRFTVGRAPGQLAVKAFNKLAPLPVLPAIAERKNVISKPFVSGGGGDFGGGGAEGDF